MADFGFELENQGVIDSTDASNTSVSLTVPDPLLAFPSEIEINFGAAPTRKLQPKPPEFTLLEFPSEANIVVNRTACRSIGPPASPHHARSKQHATGFSILSIEPLLETTVPAAPLVRAGQRPAVAARRRRSIPIVQLASSALGGPRRVAFFVIGRCRAGCSSARSFQRRLRQRVYLALGTLSRWRRQTAGAAQHRLIATSRGIRMAMSSARDRGLAFCTAMRRDAQGFGMRAAVAARRRLSVPIVRLASSALDGPRRLAFFVVGRSRTSYSGARSFQRRLRQRVYLPLGTLSRWRRQTAGAAQHRVLATSRRIRTAMSSARDRGLAFCTAARQRVQSFGIRVKSLHRAARRAGNQWLASFAAWRPSANLEERAQASLRTMRSAGPTIGRALASPVCVIALCVTTVVVLMMPWIPRVMTVTRRTNVAMPTVEPGGTEALAANVRVAPTPLPAPQPGGARSGPARPRVESTVSMRNARQTSSTASRQLPPTKPVVAAARQQTTATAVGSDGTNRVDANVALRQASTTQQPPPAYRGSLAVSSSPSGARVFLNGVPAGVTPVLLNDIPVGSRVVRIELDGHERWSATARIVANEETRVTAALRPASNRQ